MKHRLYFVLLCASMAATLTSCDRDSLKSLFGESKRQYIKVNVLSSDYIGTRSEQKTVQEPVLTSVYGDDDFSISEYVCDIEDVIGAPGTRGSIITTTGINAAGQSFTVDGWGMISPQRGEPQVLTNHLPKLTASYTSSGTEHWPWAGDANPKWVNEAYLHIWSYYPVGKISPTITIDDSTPANNKAVFTNYTTDNTDLLIAYNNEYREFQKDAAGNHTYNAAGEIVDPIIGEESFNVKFYHALAAIEFELETETSGADVHSITLCKVNTDGNIVTTDGIAITGDCTVTGPNISTNGISWGNLSGKKPFHYEFVSGQSVAGGYTSATGKGVFFMIPQDIEDIVVIVEFSKNGSPNYYTKVGKLKPSNDTSMDVSWNPGKYYKYKLSIDEFHVPGENYPELLDVDIAGLMNSPNNIQPSSALSIKGVTKVGFVINSWKLGSDADQKVYLNAIVDDESQVEFKTVSKITSPDESKTPNKTFYANFEPVSDSPISGTTNVYSFGTDDVKETYHTYYTFSPPTGPKKSNMGTPKIGPFYYVFDTTGGSKFQIVFTPSAGDNSGGFWADVRCLIVIEVAEDPNVPGNFNTIDWDAI